MRIPDRQKQRREYLKKKAGNFSKGFVAALVAMVLAAVTGLFIAFGAAACIGACMYGSGSSLLIGAGLLIAAFLLGRTTLKSGHFARRQVSTGALLPYVPPVTPN